MSKSVRSPIQLAVTIEALRFAEAKFWSRVDVGKRSECWMWKRGVTGSGYGSFVLPGEVSPTGVALHINAHRVAWMLDHGRVPPKHAVIDHLCGNRLCCNPQHLDAVAQVINSTRAGVLGIGFKSAQPKAYCAKDGTVTWRVRFRRYGEMGKVTESSKTFPSRNAALEFISTQPWQAHEDDLAE